jgi:hypothetical protein
MPAGQPILGAVGLSRCVSVKRVLGTATGGDRRTEKRPSSKERRGDSLWRLAGVEARAFGPVRRNSGLSRYPAQTAQLMSLIFYERRVHPSGQAVCLLGLRVWRFGAAVAALVVLIGCIGAFSPYTCIAVAVAVVVSLLPRAVRTGRAFAATARLRTLLPERPYVYVHSMASTLPGAGAELLAELAHEAGDKGWSLVLDASNQKLAAYYGRLGFVAQGEAVKMPGGGSRVRMWRGAPALQQPLAKRGRRHRVKR